MKDASIDDLNKHKKALRQRDVKVGDKLLVKKETRQAQEFIRTHNKRDLDTLIRLYKTEMFADLLDWLIIKNAVFELDGKYSTYPDDLKRMILEMTKIRNHALET